MKYISLLIFSILIFSHPTFAENSTVVDSLRATITGQSGETYVNSLNELSAKLVEMKKLNDANTIAFEALEKAKKMSYQEGIANAFDQLGMVCQARYDYTNAMKYFVQGLKIRDILNDKKGIATSKNNIGVVFFQQEDPESSEENLVNALAIREEIGDQKGAAETHKNLGDLYLFKKLYGKAQEHYDKAFRIRGSLGDAKGAAAIATHIGEIMTDLGSFEGALVYYQRSLDLNSSIEDLNGISKDFNNITLTHIEQEAYEEALDFNEKAMRVRQQLHDQIGIAESYKNFGVIYSRIGQYEDAKRNLAKSVELLKEVKTQMGKQDIYKDISNAYFAMKDYQNAYQNQLMYVREKEKFFSYEKSTALLELTTKYESEFAAEKQKAEIANLKQKESYNQKFNYFLFAMLGLGLLFMMSLYKSYTRKKKDNEKLTMMNEEIKKQKEEISKQHDLVAEKNQNLDVLNSKLVDEMAERESIEESSFARDRFLATMAHEMRTPMNIITGLTHLLLEENPTPAQVEHLRTLQFSANNLVVFINDVLDYSKIEAGRITLEKRNFSIRKTFEEVMSRFRLPAEDKSVSLNFTMDPKIPENLTGDPTRLNQILTNLVGNSIQYTDKGAIDINAKLETMNKKEVVVMLTIADTGRGMEQAQLEGMFHDFKRKASDMFEGYGSTGLELAITKRLVDLQNGKIEGKSNVGEGTTFTLYLPFKIADKTSVESKNITPKKKTFEHLAGNKILLVEDNKINQLVVAKILRKLGMEVVTADDGIEALEAIDRMYFDLCLMDIQMPKMDGYRATAQIRKNTDPRKRDLPIIALTASAFLTEKEKARLFGMNDHVGKPFGQEDLLEKISDCLAVYKKQMK
ncbi:MAG TPA: tetratricopeptide repeat protein [Phaeodactylibacter sp.]|nr:tetratricopeptide repeat protein [Phaeodactylibacter sp.]